MANSNACSSLSTVSLVALVLALVIALPGQSDAFIRIMGDSDISCVNQGSYCYVDSTCCSGLVCRYSYKRSGGVCERETFGYGNGMREMPSRIDCQADGDCPPGQCCVNVPIGVRGASIRSCRAQCPNKDVDAILSDFYSRYYRSAYYRRRRRSADVEHLGN